MSQQPRLSRQLGLFSALAIGVGSIIGAGIFSVFPSAAGIAGAALIPALLLAAAVAFANALSSAQLAAVYPESGGSYVYGRRVLGLLWGFSAGWSFIIGKTASLAAMALTFGYYLAPQGYEKVAAVAAVVALGVINLLGVTRTALAAAIIAGISVPVLLLVIVSSSQATPEGASLWGSSALPNLGWEHWPQLLQAAGLLFFAFAGYARIATMGEEVRNPEQTIPRAIALSLGIAVLLYLGVALALLSGLGLEKLQDSPAALTDLVRAAGWDWAVWIVTLGAATASLGALLALMTGVGRTSLAMARGGDLPKWFANIDPKYQVPRNAELTLMLIVVLLVLFTDLRGAIGFSSFGVLCYYFIANISALKQPKAERRYPRVIAFFGALSCAALVIFLPAASVITGLVVLGTGIAGWLFVGALRRRRAAS